MVIQKGDSMKERERERERERKREREKKEEKKRAHNAFSIQLTAESWLGRSMRVYGAGQW